jgi:hypothetical protein
MFNMRKVKRHYFFAVQSKMNSGKESVTIAEFGMRIRLIRRRCVACQSARGLAHSTTLRAFREPSAFAPASWTAVALHRFSPGAIAESVFIRVHPWLKIQMPLAPIVHSKMNSGKESVANAEFGMQL